MEVLGVYIVGFVTGFATVMLFWLRYRSYDSCRCGHLRFQHTTRCETLVGRRWECAVDACYCCEFKKQELK